MQHVALGSLGGIEHLYSLLIVLGAKRSGDQSLRFATRKDGRAVRTRQHGDFTRNRANLVKCAAVGTATILQHLVAEDALFQSIEYLAGFDLVSFIFEQAHRF